jgi:preprotein translocase subunit SecG
METLSAVILVIHLIVTLAIIVTILIQPSESGGFMGNSGSMSNLMVQRRTGDGLTRATTILAGIFFMTSLILAITATHRPAQKSILDIETDPAKTEQTAVEPKKAEAPDAPTPGEKVTPAEESKQAPAEEKKIDEPAEKPAKKTKK